MVYKVDIQTLHLGEYWTNVWHVNAAGLTEASDFGNDIAVIMAKLLPEYSAIVQILTTDVPTGGFISRQVSILGTRAQGAGDGPLPNWNRYLLSLVPASGYHGKKFLGVVRESDTEAGKLNSTALTYIDTNVCQPLEALGCLCSPQGFSYLEVTVRQPVGMRQLRRARKRTTPVLTP